MTAFFLGGPPACGLVPVTGIKRAQDDSVFFGQAACLLLGIRNGNKRAQDDSVFFGRAACLSLGIRNGNKRAQDDSIFLSLPAS